MARATAPATILVVGHPGTSMAAVVDADPDIHLVGDIDTAVDLVSGDDAPQLVVLVAGTDRPLAWVRRLRAADRRVGIALTVPTAEVEETRQRLSFAPELGAVAVVGGDQDPELLGVELRSAAERISQQRQLRRTLDAMNRGLASSAASGPAAPAPSVSERYLAALTRHLPEGVVSVDGNGRVVTMNPSATDVLGVSLEAAEGRVLLDLLDSEDQAAVGEVLDRAAGGRVAELDDLVVRHPAGHRLLVNVTAAPVSDERDRVVGIVLLVRDVTDDRRTEERLRELQKAESLATLAGGVAHDFNNLLVSVQSWAGMAAEDVSDSEMVTTALEHIQRASRRAAELARSMLAYAGRGTFELEPTDLNDVVREMSGLLKAAISRKTEVVIEPTRPLPTVLVDATQVRQVVMNLVTNAAEAIGDRPGSIHLRTSSVELPAVHEDASDGDSLPPGAYVVIEVEDTGSGMDGSTMSRIFDPFFTTKFTGRGLGLAASSGIVRAHGGAIRVESRPGEGSVFRVFLPTEEDV
ncbi:MAG: PAS domain S-box protein [Actinobacteria bacterium]|nr:PAS domain S-box protein [Actinomycetota bacterium]